MIVPNNEDLNEHVNRFLIGHVSGKIIIRAKTNESEAIVNVKMVCEERYCVLLKLFLSVRSAFGIWNLKKTGTVRE